MLRLALPLSLILLSACAETVVMDYNGHSIRIQSQSRTVDAEALAEARRICGTQGLQAEYASTVFIEPSLTYRHLFLCLSRTKPNAGLPPGSVPRTTYLETTATL